MSIPKDFEIENQSAAPPQHNQQEEENENYQIVVQENGQDDTISEEEEDGNTEQKHALINEPEEAKEEAEEENDDEEDDEEDDKNLDEEENIKKKTPYQSEQQEKLKAEVLEFKDLWDKFNSEYEKSPNLLYFLVSIKWLKTWKKHVSFNRVSKDLEPNYQHFANYTTQLENANEDLIKSTVQELSKEYYEIEGDSQTGASIILKPKLRDSEDYTIIDNDLVNFFAATYEGFSIIPRRAYLLPSGRKKTEVYYKQVNLTILNHNLLKDIDMSTCKALTSKKIQICTGQTQRELKEFLVQVVQKNSSQTIKSSSILLPDSIRLWNLSENEALSSLFDKLYSATRSSNSFDYRFRIELPLLERTDDSITLDQLKITDGMTIIVEMQKEGGWFFKLEGEPEEKQCEYCRSFRVLQIECRCKKVQYCSESCKEKDIDYHNRVCDLAGEESEEEKDGLPLSFKTDSVRGLCGLQNIGNTCFMNSALQCLSNTEPLTKYFLNQNYLLEINEENVLGQKGNLARKYAKFIEKVWIGSQDKISPTQLKTAIAKAQPMYEDYSQHDSQEFLQYILDGLHEDLNRVRNKQQTEQIDSNGREDQVVAKESWKNNMKRDQSIIIDLMKGQYKSKVTCPSCKRQSITFDPFLSVSLPIPNIKSKQVRAYLIFYNNRQIAKDVVFQYDPLKNLTIKDFKQHCANLYDLDASRLELLQLTFTQQKEIYQDSQPLEEFRKKTKYLMKNILLIEHNFSLSVDTNGHNTADSNHMEDYSNPSITGNSLEPAYQSKVRLIVQFTRLKIYYRDPTKESITFVRPFLFDTNVTAQDVRKAIFSYLIPIFKRDTNQNSDFVTDAQSFTDDQLYQKYFVESEDPPYALKVNSDSSEFLKKPCSWCQSINCNDCNFPDNFKTSLSDFIQASSNSNHNFKLHCIVNTNNDLGNQVNGLNSLDESDQKGKISQAGSNTKSQDTTTLEDCLDLFSQPEELGEDNLWYCSVCKEHQKAIKQLQIYSAPEILVLHMKRFKGSGGLFKAKLTKLVDFPLDSLDMTKYVISKKRPSSFITDFPDEFNGLHIPPAESQNEQIEEESDLQSIPSVAPTNNSSNQIDIEEEKLIYDLYAVTNHFGSLGFGHYTAFTKNNGKWYDFDDSTVSQINPDKVVSEASYILFYKRRS